MGGDREQTPRSHARHESSRGHVPWHADALTRTVPEVPDDARTPTPQHGRGDAAPRCCLGARGGDPGRDCGAGQEGRTEPASYVNGFPSVRDAAGDGGTVHPGAVALPRSAVQRGSVAVGCARRRQAPAICESRVA